MTKHDTIVMVSVERDPVLKIRKRLAYQPSFVIVFGGLPKWMNKIIPARPLSVVKKLGEIHSNRIANVSMDM